MIQTCEQIFLKRADAYHKAMGLYPRARDLEFQLAVSAADIKPGPAQVNMAWSLHCIVATSLMVTSHS